MKKIITLQLSISALSILQVNADLPYGDTYYTSSLGEQSGQSLSITASDSFGSCTCNLTPNGCDSACCCDPDCPASTVATWTLKQNYCLNEQNNQAILKYSQCLDRTTIGGLDDLQDGLKVYGKNIRGLFCISSSSSKESISTFIGTQYSAKTAIDFNNTLNSLASNTLQYQEISENSSPTISYVQLLQGYSANEPLVGYTNSVGVAQYNLDQKLYLQRSDLYGLCSRGKPIKFQQDQETDQCGYLPQPMTQQFCTNQLSPKKSALSFQISNDTTLVNITTLVPGVQRNFSLNTLQDLGVNNSTIFYDSSYNSTDCSCLNMLLEAHYTVYFQDFNSSFGVQNQINNITVDLVYGKYIPTSCSVNVQLTLKTSIQFKQSIYSRKNSGGPGYIKGKKLLSGVNATFNSTTYVNESSTGFAIRGADNSGLCYNIQTSLTSGNNVTNYLIQSPAQSLYTDDPILSFDDSTIYGCKLQLTRQQLNDFCTNKGWQNLMIFQNFQELQYIGRYGNANPHFITDWIEAAVDTTKDKTDITVDWDNTTGSCSFPSAYFVQVFFTKINTRGQPQYQIVKVSHYADTLNAWVFKKPDPTQKQDFPAIVSLQFYEVDQSDSFYAPPTPNPIKALPRNILYPFYIYGSATYQIFSLAALVTCSVVYFLI